MKDKRQKQKNGAVVTLVGVLVMFILLLVDLVTKALAEGYNWQTGRFLGIIGLSYIQNTGIAYGWFGGDEVMMTIVTVLTVAMIAAIAVVYFMVFKRNTPVRFVLAIIEAGAVGNLVDRLVLGYVRDFIDIQRIGFGIANIADFYIVLGAVALVFILLFIGEDALIPLKKEWREKAKEKEESKQKQKAGNDGKKL